MMLVLFIEKGFCFSPILQFGYLTFSVHIAQMSERRIHCADVMSRQPGTKLPLTQVEFYCYGDYITTLYDVKAAITFITN